MVIKSAFEELFDCADDGTILISQDAPSVLTEAIEKARENLIDDEDIVIRAVGQARRAMDFGLNDLTVIQTNSATLFAGEQPEEGVKILAVGVSRDGPLTDSQVEDILGDFSAEAHLSREEMAITRDSSRALRSIKQAKYFVTYNSDSLASEIGELKSTLTSEIEDNDDKSKRVSIVESELHNLLSAVYTFSETVEQSLRSIDLLRTSKHYVQKYEDSISTAVGMRHYIQHKSALQIQWIATYNHDLDEFDYCIGVPTTEVCDSELYHPINDAAGNSPDPLDYYYGDIDGFLIDLDDIVESVKTSTETTYNDLKTHLQDEHIEGSEILKQFHRIKSYNLNQIHDNRS